MWIRLEYYYFQIIWFKHKNAVYLCMCTMWEMPEFSVSWMGLSPITTICVSCYCRQCTQSRCIVLWQKHPCTLVASIHLSQFKKCLQQFWKYSNVCYHSPHLIVIKSFCSSLVCRSLKIDDLNYRSKGNSSHTLKNHVSKVPNSSTHSNLFTTPPKKNCSWLFTYDCWKKKNWTLFLLHHSFQSNCYMQTLKLQAVNKARTIPKPCVSFQLVN